MLQPERDLSISPLFQAMFVMQQDMTATQHAPGHEEPREAGVSGALDVEHTTTKFDLSLFVSVRETGLYCGIEYCRDLFEPATIGRMLEHWQILLEGIVAQPEQPILSLPLLTEAEKHQVLVEWNATEAAYPEQASIPHLFEGQVLRTPDAEALVYEGSSLTYRELNRRANLLACELRSRGVKADTLVGVCMERSVEMVVALLGVLKAGGAYVPMDPAYPQERLAYMLEDAAVSVLLTQSALREQLPQQSARVFTLDAGWGADGNGELDNLTPNYRPEHLIYMIYTSGSTGQPKGVMNTHRGVCNRLHWMQQEYQLTAEDRVLQKTPFSFDVSVWEFFWPLISGATLVMARPGGQSDAAYLARLIEEQRISTLHFVPSMLHAFLLEPELEARCQSLKRVICSGEVLTYELQERFFARLKTQLHNLYGPTEAAIDVTYWACQSGSKESVIPIGRPIANTQIYILDEAQQPVPVGVSGELYIGGVGVARGYHQRPELNREKFIPDPSNKDEGARLFRSGDLARYRPDGVIEFLGRIDHQVKIRGFRIELGEIEAALARHAAIHECVVIAREDTPGDKRLVAYIVPAANASPSREALRAFLLAVLPDYMVPAFFVLLDTLPLTVNGKLDRQALPIPDHARPELAEEFVQPRTPSEEILAGIWSSVLGIGEVGVHDNFFVLGGDSIRSIQVLSQARERGLHFTLQQLFQHQTIYALAQVLKQEEARLLLAEQLPPFALLTPDDRANVPLGVEDAYPLARLQAGMLFHSQYSPGTAIYHDINSYHVQARFDEQCLRAALQQLAAYHAVLRTSFELEAYSEPVQLVHASVEIPLRVADMRQIALTEQEQSIAQWIEQDKADPFDWRQAPLLRFHVHLRTEESFQLSLSFHHSILDGWSVASLLTELFRSYLALLKQGEQTPSLPPPSVQFRDFVALERRAIKPDVTQRYWQEKLAGSTRLQLPQGKPGERISQVASGVHVEAVPISLELSQQLKQLAREAAVPIKSVLLAAHLRVLQLLSGQRDILTGLVSNGRPEIADGERILGLFLNTLPLRQQLAGGTWFDLVKQTFESECELLPHRWYPLAEMQRVQGGHRLFETIFNFLHFHVYQDVLSPEAPTAQDLRVVGRQGFEKTNFVLAANFSLDPLSSHVRLALRGDATVLNRGQIEAVAHYYANTLNAMANDPHGRYETPSLLTEQETRQLITLWNATSADYPRDKGLHELFVEQAERIPERIALVSGEQHLTYAALEQRVERVAAHISALDMNADRLVGVYMERSLEMMIAILGVLRAGGAYIPLDPTYPRERLAFMIEDSRLAVVLAQPALQHDLPIPVRHVACIQQNGEVEQFQWENDATESQMSTLQGQLAYVIYTSGSTGRPKGTTITHSSVVNFIQSMCQRPGITEDDSILAVTSLSFDIAVLELLLPLTIGARVHLVGWDIAADGAKLAAYLADMAVTLMQATPTTWRLLLGAGWRGEERLKMLCGGEVLPLELAAQLVPKGASLWNMYGPTETTIWSTTGRIAPEPASISIGQPIANTQVYVLNAYYQPVPVGVTGELYIAGNGLARGYLHHPGLTAERFLPDPFCPDGARMYRTGDLARWLADGTLECLGRVDSQVKLRGFRIELSEIEEVLNQSPAVRANAVIVRDDDQGGKRLVAYVVLEPGAASSRIELRRYLQGRLPEYMLPTHFVLLEQLPLTPNGKIDRKALPMPASQEDEENSWAEARTPIEEALVEIWRAVLEVPRVGIHDNFFELGGHSLLATQLMARVRTVLQVTLPLRTLFDAPTVVLLAPLVEQAMRGIAQEPSIAPLRVTTRPVVLPLSFAQQRLWFLDRLEPQSTAYLISNARLLRGELDLVALGRSIQALVQRHESLRTIIQVQNDEPAQFISPARGYRLPIIDLRGLQEDARQRSARMLVTQEAQQPCDLMRGPLFRCSFVRLADEEGVLLVTMHHIISDAWSMQLFYSELRHLYQALTSDDAPTLPALPVQYPDYALWQRGWLQGEVLATQMAYWQAQLADVPALDLPTDYLRPPLQSYRGATLSLEVAKTLQDELHALAQREGVTMFMLLLAAFQVLLMRYTNQCDISVGTPITNRTRAELEHIIGLFVNTLVLRTDLSGNPSFVDLLARVREVALGAYTYQDIPFEQLVEALQPTRDMSRSPLFQVMFTTQQVRPTTSGTVETVAVQSLKVEQQTARFDLTLSVTMSPQGLYCSVEYSTDLFKAQTISTLLQHWQTLLEAIVRTPRARLADLSIVTEAEYQLIADSQKSRSQTWPIAQYPHTLFARQAEQTPDAVATLYGDEHITYGLLEQRANSLAQELRRRYAVGPDVAVGICLPRSLDMIIALLAVLKASGAYVPLDLAYPQERLRMIVEETQCAVVLTQTSLIDALAIMGASTLCLDAWRGKPYEQQEVIVPAHITPDNIAYIIYTSGSTGRPKGVLVPHGAMLNHCLSVADAYHMSVQDRVLQFASLSFDVAAEEIWPTLASGATLVLCAQETLASLTDLLALSARQQVTILNLPAAYWHTWVAELPQERTDVEALRLLVIGSDKVLTERLAEWKRCMPERIRWCNAYGPTETTITATVYEPGDTLPETAIVPIGFPLANVATYVLDQFMQPVPECVYGELYIGGPGVARGYLNNPQLTAAHFLPDPFSGVPGARVYRTGDIVRYRPGGALEIRGRQDAQVKVRGYRIELGEIEAALAEHPAIQACIVLALPDKTGEHQRLVAYCIGQTHDLPSTGELRTYLQKKLPAYMLPATFVTLAAFPLRPNGKVDYAALAHQTIDEPATTAERTGERTTVEELLAAIWCNALDSAQARLQDDFFLVGGNSLLAMRLLARIRAELQVEIPVRTLFEHSTFGALLQHIEHALRSEWLSDQPPLVPVSRQQALPLSFAQQRLWFLYKLDPTSPAYLIPHVRRLYGPLDMAIFGRSIAELLRRHESLRTTFEMRGDEAVQVIGLAPRAYCVPVIDLEELPATRREQEILRLREDETRVPFRLERGPLLRAWLLKSDHQAHTFLATMHHISSDGWSMQIFERELLALYEAFTAGLPSPLPPLAIQYADYALWQRQWLQGAVLERHLDYWIPQLSGAAPVTLPVDHPYPEMPSHQGVAHLFKLSGALTQALIQLSHQEHVTLFMTLITAFQVLLYRYSGQRDIVVGTDSANRTLLETESLIGFFINVLPLRTSLHGQPSFRELLKRVREVVLGAMTHQETPFDLLVEKLVPTDRQQRLPLVQVLFVMQDMAQDTPREPAGGQSDEQSYQALADVARAAKFDLALFLYEMDGQLYGTLNYRRELFEAQTIATMMQRWTALLDQVTHQIDLPIEHLTFLAPGEHQQRQEQEHHLRQQMRSQADEWFELPGFDLADDAQ
ncbi:hypothetical protein KSB_85880 [Ktedonobacter robiniae]|uniref:Carrier domain-containing protein n=1 Tax=Ktedonobacter robiniae TaxID=2778365 RepID=A0ABQ3V526_9CHLR|nr:hypothetical protein KSB_85880 [Ktedonobacter robiniae]